MKMKAHTDCKKIRESVLLVKTQNGSSYRIFGELADRIIKGSEKMHMEITDYIKRYNKFKDIIEAHIICRSNKNMDIQSKYLTITISFKEYMVLGAKNTLTIRGKEAMKIKEQADKLKMGIDEYLKSPLSPYKWVESITVNE
ncbi:TVG1179765 [Thermoplasma volcanium GSS1]|uniref:TVG1179765 protein n=1 Tax=Thermoplasma volcanium (strain ATCC 51530 / DSM 4299 / JCM 9571 / NBRC 15438 / GSS1) TaxID=273116 RepID=Q979L1_THEVO|nr:hypothetical protein [Thermoplasma volcanium]BAB60292.1 TVG1179765 [Thermoplasma volcanium GSS1]